MTRGVRPSLRVALVLTVLGLALVQAAAPAATAQDSGKQRQRQPTLLWKVYPLQQHPTARDEVTIRRALRLLGQPAVGAQTPGSTRSPEVVLLLLVAALLLGISALRQPAFAAKGLAGFIVRWRTELLVVGSTILVMAVVVLVLT
jgi:hypothetical protein